MFVVVLSWCMGLVDISRKPMEPDVETAHTKRPNTAFQPPKRRIFALHKTRTAKSVWPFAGEIRLVNAKKSNGFWQSLRRFLIKTNKRGIGFPKNPICCFSRESALNLKACHCQYIVICSPVLCLLRKGDTGFNHKLAM